MTTQTNPKAFKQKRAEETREKIITAGTRLFCEEGYHNVSSKKIARAAEVAIGSFYNYFKDKKELLFEIHKRHAASVHHLIEEKLKQGFLDNEFAGDEFSKQLVAQVLEMHSLSPELHREIAALSFSDADFAAVIRTEDKRVVKILSTLLEAHKSRLRIKDVEAASWVVALSIESVVHTIKIFGSPISKQRLTATLGEMIHRLLFES